MQKRIDNGGKRRSLGQSMREAGYSESYARNPHKIKQTKAWQEYLEDFIPDEQIANAHKTLLEAQRVGRMDFPVSLTNKEVTEVITSSGRIVLAIKRTKQGVGVSFTEPDFTTRARAVDLAYKVKGLYGESKVENPHREYEHLSDEELEALIEQYKGFYKKTSPLPSL